MSARLDPVAVPLDGTLLVEAGAGTGKTWTLGALALRFLLEEGLELPALLVLTFTEAATAELRDRLRRRIEEARRALLESGDPADPFLRALRERLHQEGRWDDGLALRRLEAALASFDEASIFTIHGFCRRVLAEHAVDLGLPAQLALADSDAGFLRRTVLDALRSRFDQVPEPLLDWLRTQGGLHSPGPWLALAQAACRHPEAARPARAPSGHLLEALAPLLEERRRRVDAARAAFSATSPAALASLIEAAKLNKGSYKPDRQAAMLEAVAAWLEAGAPSGACPDARRYTPAAMAAKTTKAGHTPEDPAFVHLGGLLEGEASLGAAFAGILASWQAEALEEWPRLASRARMEARQLVFDDMLGLVAQGLEGPRGEELALALRRRWRAALVDEFQDTDPLQARIFRRVFQDGRLPLVHVGDPKQAIYAFRGADLHAYLAAVRQADRRAGLAVNWRSEAGLLDAVNRVFSAERFPAGRGAFLRPDIQAPPLDPCGEVASRILMLDGKPLAPFRVLHLPQDGLPKPEARRLVAAGLARSLARLLDPPPGEWTGWSSADGLEPVHGREIAVLVRTHSQGAMIVEALAEVGLACVQLSPESVHRSAEAIELELLLRALARPQDAGRCRALLAGPWARTLGFDPVQALGSTEALAALQESLQRAGQRVLRDGLLPALRRLVLAGGLPAILLGMRRGERRLTNWIHLLDLLGGPLGAGTQDPAELARRLAWARDGGAGEAELRLESEDDLVQVLTLHKSKGLEFPLVCCPFLWDEGMRTESHGVALLHGEDGAARLRPWSRALPLEEDERAIEQTEELAESVRLAYVGLTRARHHLLVHSVTPGSTRQRVPGALDWLLAGGRLARELPPGRPDCWKEVWADGQAVWWDAWQRLAKAGSLGVECWEPALEIGGVRNASLPAATRTAEPLATPTARIPQGPRTCSFSSLLTGHAEDERLDEWWSGAPEPDGPTGDWRARFPRGTAAGTCLHRLLELAFSEPCARPAQQEERCARELRAHGLDPDLAAGTSRWLDEILAMPLHEGGFQLGSLEAGRCAVEMKFHLPVLAPLPQAAFRALAERHALCSARRLGLDEPWPAHPAPLPDDLPTGFLKGFVDQIHEEDGRWWVLDWKSNHLGDQPAAYHRRALADEMARSGYLVQGLLYLLALHRHLRLRLPGYQPDRHLGGMRYLFLRGVDARRPGQGLFEDRPPLELILELDEALGGRGWTR